MFDKSRGQHAPDDLPESEDIVIYTHYCINGYDWDVGRIKHFSSDCSGEDNILLCNTPLHVEIPRVDNIKQKVLEALETEKKKQIAEHHAKMFHLQEKIDSLLCLEYKPSEEPEKSI